MRVFAVLAALFVLGCSVPYSARTLDVIQEHRIRKLAILPLSVTGDVDPKAADAADVPSEASAIVTSRLLLALTDLEPPFSVVPPEEVERWRMSSGQGLVSRDSRSLAREITRAFGVDALLTGTVRRYRQRVGGERGVDTPAAVWFELELRSPKNRLLWRGTFDETQRPLSEDLGSFPRARDRGFRWVTAEALATYGARHLMIDMVKAASWR